MTTPLLPPTCVVAVDGVRFADGSPADDPTAPTALDGLRITWGRNSTLDQPEPATLAFNAVDRTGGQHYRTVLHVGARVDVTATATLYPTTATQSMLTDPTFTAAATGPYPTNAAGRVNVASAVVAAGALRITPTSPLPSSKPATVSWGPAPVTSPTSWDALPQAKAGQAWTYGATVAVAAGLPAQVTVRPVEFATADLKAWRLLPGDPHTSRTWAGGSVTLTGTALPTAGRWVGLQIVVHRIGSAWDEVAAGVAWDALDATWTWDTIGSVVVDDLVLLAPAAGTDRTGRVFSGRITDLDTAWDTDLDAPVVVVICQDDTAELDNRYVGDTPWPTEGLATRAGKIVAASGQTITLQVDAGVAATSIAARDVDAQPAASLLQGLAQSVVGVLWNAASTGAGSFLRIEDINSRVAMLVLAKGADNVIRIVPADSQNTVDAGGITLDACEILLEPVHWQQTSEDDATRVSVGWKDVGTTPATARTTTAVNADAEAATGRRAVNISTELALAADAARVADLALGRLTTPGWRVSGIVWSMLTAPVDSYTLQRMMKVLDGVTRIGLPVLVTGIPAWSAIAPQTDLPTYLEGGELRFEGGAWTVNLLTSNARSQGQAGVAWDEQPADWTWDQYDPAITWNDLQGVDI